MAVQLNDLPRDPIRVVVQMEPQPPAPPAEETLQDRVKKVAGWAIVAIGAILLAGAFCMLGGHALGFLATEPAIAQTLFLCGLSAALGGFGLQNSQYKGSFSVAPPGFPLTFKVEQK